MYHDKNSGILYDIFPAVNRKWTKIKRKSLTFIYSINSIEIDIITGEMRCLSLTLHVLITSILTTYSRYVFPLHLILTCFNVQKGQYKM
jgi:hypothetical protein